MSQTAASVLVIQLNEWNRQTAGERVCMCVVLVYVSVCGKGGRWDKSFSSCDF